jgi:hypothetical protein
MRTKYIDEKFSDDEYATPEEALEDAKDLIYRLFNALYKLDEKEAELVFY